MLAVFELLVWRHDWNIEQTSKKLLIDINNSNNSNGDPKLIDMTKKTLFYIL